METLECGMCWKMVPITEFYKHKGGRSGRGAYCKPCVKRQTQEKRGNTPKISEREFTKDVIKLAHDNGWRVAHFKAAIMPSGKWATPVQGDGKGFPDLMLVKEPFDLPGINTRVMEIKKAVKETGEFKLVAISPNMRHVVAAELKVNEGELRDEQIEWLLAFNGAGIPAYVWTPDDMDGIKKILEVV